jgi:hypothetical protein
LSGLVWCLEQGDQLRDEGLRASVLGLMLVDQTARARLDGLEQRAQCIGQETVIEIASAARKVAQAD